MRPSYKNVTKEAVQTFAGTARADRLLIALENLKRHENDALTSINQMYEENVMIKKSRNNPAIDHKFDKFVITNNEKLICSARADMEKMDLCRAIIKKELRKREMKCRKEIRSEQPKF